MTAACTKLRMLTTSRVCGLYAQVDDAQVFLEMAASLGGTVVGEAQEVPGQGIKVGQFLDPEGNMFGVVQPLQG